MRFQGWVGALAVGVSALVGQSADAVVTPVVFDWATVGNAGNAADTTGFGSVAMDYRISKHEVTNTQYTAFLNAVDATGANGLGLFNNTGFGGGMPGNFGGIELQAGNAEGSRYVAQAGRGLNPVTFVDFYDTLRFTNWLHNGQGNGSTETGAYTLLGGTATPSNGANITRNADAKFSLPSENEWYKAAYHDESAGTAGTYFDFATGSDDIPVSDQPGDNAAGVNYFSADGIANGFNDGYAVSGSASAGTNPFTDVGAYTDADSPYGTFDQNGNVWEWNEALISGSSRGLRGGSWGLFHFNLRSSNRISLSPSDVINDVGFRVASPVPEPGSLALLAVAAPMILRRRRG